MDDNQHLDLFYDTRYYGKYNTVVGSQKVTICSVNTEREDDNQHLHVDLFLLPVNTEHVDDNQHLHVDLFLLPCYYGNYNTVV